MFFQERLREGMTTLGLPWSEEGGVACAAFMGEFFKWNKKMNLSAIRDEEEFIEKHLLDSLTLLPFVEGCSTLLDLGSGGGFPGIPLQIFRPALRIVSVDGVEKKILFQRHVARTLGLENFVALHCRIEALPKEPRYKRGFDCITARALADVETLAAWARPLLRTEGELLLMRGEGGAREWTEARPALMDAGFSVGEGTSFALPFSGSKRFIARAKLAP